MILHSYNTIDSTNEEAKRIIRDGKTETPFLVTAHHQTHGKGTNGRIWLTKEGQNAILSLVVENVPNSVIPLAIKVGYALTIVLSSYGIKSKIKFPNDVYVDSKKVAGVLIEKGKWGSERDFTIIGVGLNVNQIEFANNIPDATSMRLQTGQEYLIDEITHTLASTIYTEIFNATFKIEEYNRAFIHFDEPVKVLDLKGASLANGYFAGLNENGDLTLLSNEKVIKVKPDNIGKINHV